MKYYVVFQYDAFAEVMTPERYDDFASAMNRFHGICEFFPDRSFYVIEVSRRNAEVIASHRSNQLS